MRWAMGPPDSGIWGFDVASCFVPGKHADRLLDLHFAFCILHFAGDVKLFSRLLLVTWYLLLVKQSAAVRTEVPGRDC